MNVISIGKNTINTIQNSDDQLIGLSLYNGYDTLSIKEWIDYSISKDHEMYGLMIDQKLVAVASVNEASDYRMNRWKEIRSLYAHKDYQDVKYGSLLVDKIINRVDDRGYENTYMWVREEDLQSRKFFELQNIIPNGNREQRLINGREEELLRYVYVNL